MGRPALLVNAAELLRQPGQRRHIDVVVPMVDVEVRDRRLSGDISVDVVLESTVDDIDVAGELRVAWADTCSRCLRPVAATLVIEVEERYAPAERIGTGTVDPDAFPIEHGQLDLAPMVREEVLLGVPDAPLCREDCPGLCPVCGADRASERCDCPTEVRDERWAVLDQLRLEEA